MDIRKGNVLYARIDYKIGKEELSQQDFQDHLDYIKNTAKERYLWGGGFLNADGGMILFEACNEAEAQKIAHQDPMIQKGIYRCEVFTWKVEVFSGENTE